MISIQQFPKVLKQFVDTEITIGTDLEVSLHTYSNKFNAVSGLDYWSGVKEGKIGTDGRTKFFQYLVELRPDPGHVGEDLLANLKDMLSTEVKRKPELKNYVWKAGTCDFHLSTKDNWILPKGGHIHFGKTPLTDEAVYGLDCLLAPLVLLLEDPIRAVLRRCTTFDFNGGTCYGQLGDSRARPRIGTWEYRTLPNFCKTPFLVTSIFNIAKAIVFDAIEGRLSGLLRRKIYNLKPNTLMFNICCKRYHMTKMSVIFDILSKLKLLDNDYGKAMLTEFKRYIKSGFKWSIDSDMLEDFGICTPADLHASRNVACYTDNAIKLVENYNSSACAWFGNYHIHTGEEAPVISMEAILSMITAMFNVVGYMSDAAGSVSRHSASEIKHTGNPRFKLGGQGLYNFLYSFKAPILGTIERMSGLLNIKPTDANTIINSIFSADYLGKIYV